MLKCLWLKGQSQAHLLWWHHLPSKPMTLLNMTAISLFWACPQDWKLLEARTELTGSLQPNKLQPPVTVPQQPRGKMAMPPLFCFLRFLFIFRERGKEGERERNINVWVPFTRPLLRTWPATQACALTGNRTQDPLVYRPALNPLSYTSQGPILFKIQL